MSTPFQFKHAIDLTLVEIEGARTRLVPIHERYAPVIFAEFTSSITRYMLPKPPEKIEETLDFIQLSRVGMLGGYDFVLAILEKDSAEFLGCCGLHNRDKPSTPELGVWLKQSAHGKKYGREAVASVARWATAHLKFDYLLYPVDKNNVPSRKIAESLGGVIIETKQVPAMHGAILDEVVYKI